MQMPPKHADVSTLAIRNYWWASMGIGMYFAGGFLAWGGTRGSVVSSALFLVGGAIGTVCHFALPWRRRATRFALVVAHLLSGHLILIWQMRHLPLSDYTASGNPDVREMLIFLVSSLVVGGMSSFGGIWGAAIGLTMHYLFLFNGNDEFSIKWTFPILIALAGISVSMISSRLDQAYRQMEQLANIDPLTGLFNRHRLQAEFERLQRTAREAGQSLLLVAWDLDDLKLVNDTEGHAAGDKYIRDFARTLESHVRHKTNGRLGDAAFRVGGDEFISLHLDGPDGETLRARTHAEFPHASAGWIRCENLTLDQAMTQADAAMYLDKAERKQGRLAHVN
jgi:GGDEF domain-containing protein